MPHPTPPGGLDAACRALEARWHGEIPITAAMGISVAAFDGACLDVRAALGPNVNVHGTAFAGSLFSLAALCGWGLVHLQMQGSGLRGDIVLVDGRIRCLAPVRDDATASSRWTESAAAALATLAGTGRCRIELSVRVLCAGELAAEFSGQYAVRRAPQ
jgi:thioesterase domain-containing protein